VWLDSDLMLIYYISWIVYSLSSFSALTLVFEQTIYTFLVAIWLYLRFALCLYFHLLECIVFVSCPCV